MLYPSPEKGTHIDYPFVGVVHAPLAMWRI
jgi:hypothetical protein